MPVDSTLTPTELLLPAEQPAAVVLPDDLIPISHAAKVMERDVNAIEYRIKTGRLQVYQPATGPRMVSQAAVLVELAHPQTRAKTRRGKRQTDSDTGPGPCANNSRTEEAAIDAIVATHADPVTSIGVTARVESGINEPKCPPDPVSATAVKLFSPAPEEEIPLEAIVTDESLQTREKTRSQVVDEYMDLMLEGHVFPPVDLFRNGDRLVVADGSHRVEAARKAGCKTIHARIHDGGRTAALLWALKSNTDHGLKLTNADKRRKIQLALAEYPNVSNTQIAAMCAVTEGTVRNFRRSIVNYEPEKRIGTDGKKYSVRKSAAAAPDRLEKSVFKQVTKLTEKLDQVALQRLRASIDGIIQERLAATIPTDQQDPNPPVSIEPASIPK